MDVELNELHLSSSEIGINIQTLSDGSVDVESQLSRPFLRNPPSEADPPLEPSLSSEIMMNPQVDPSSEIEMNVWNWMFAVAYPSVDPSSEIGMNVCKFPVAGNEAYPPLNPLSEIGMDIWNWMFVVAYPQVDPSSETGMNVQIFAVDGDEGDPPPLNPSTEIGMNDPIFAVDGDEGDPPPLNPSTEIGMNDPIFAVDGDEGDPPPLNPSTEIGMNDPMFDEAYLPLDIPLLSDGGDEADGDPQLPRSVDRFMRYHMYAAIPPILGTNVHVLADMMEPTPENKKLIGVSMMSLVGNVVASIWFFRRGNLPNVDLKNVSFKIMFVFTGILTLYSSFSTLATNWFTLPGIVLCGVLAVGLGHGDGINRLCKNFIATIKNATQKIRELIA